MDDKNKEYNIDRIVHILSEIPFFEDFTNDELDYFSRNTSLRSFPEETTLFKAGDVGSHLFFVVEGSLEVRLESHEGKPLMIASFYRGSCVGEMSMVDDFPRSATLYVKEPSELLLLTRNRFETICKENPPVGIKFLRGIAKNLSMRLRNTNGRFADLA